MGMLPVQYSGSWHGDSRNMEKGGRAKSISILLGKEKFFASIVSFQLKF
jgi:hypothetical protein